MTSIGIVGAGIGGLHLALRLQQQGMATTLYADRTAEQMRTGRLLSTVARLPGTQARERKLGVNHWDKHQIRWTHMYIGGERPLRFRGDMAEPWSFVDMRLYQATLLDDYAARGGDVRGSVEGRQALEGLSAAHDLLVIASGRHALTELFPVIPEYSPFTQPQRRLCAVYVEGIANPEPLGFYYHISPGHGEVFQAPFLSFEGPVSNLLIEAIPGQGLEHITRLRYDDDPAGFEAALRELVREHAPPVWERLDQRQFRVNRPLDILQGAVTPTVRRGWARLNNGRCIVALGDVHAVNDPVLGQGANAASHAAWQLGEAILGGGPYDEAFCQAVETQGWDYLRCVTEWTNSALAAPAPHVGAIFAAAAERKAIADRLFDQFGDPQRSWHVFGNPVNAQAFLDQFDTSRTPIAAS